MRIFVTGATGFLGSYLAEDLIARGHQVAVLIRPGANPWRLSSCFNQLEVVQGNLTEPKSFTLDLSRFRPEAVAHLAWEGVAGANRNDPAQARNILYTTVLAKLASDLGATAFVGTGSQAEYGPYNRAIREEDEMRPTTLYGWAKLAAGKMAERICVANGIRFAWMRVFSIYGPKDALYWIIPDTICQIKRGKRIALTAGEQRWGFLFVRDAASAFRLALEEPRATGVYNVGAIDAPRLRDTLEKISTLLGSTGRELGFGEVPYRPNQVMRLQADIGRLKKLGWAPRVPLSTGLQETVAWYAREN